MRNGVLGPAVGPDNRPTERFASFTTPCDRCFALVGDTCGGKAKWSSAYHMRDSLNNARTDDLDALL